MATTALIVRLLKLIALLSTDFALKGRERKVKEKWKKGSSPLYHFSYPPIPSSPLPLAFATQAIILGPVVQSPISVNPGLILNETYRVNPGLALIGL